MTRTNHKRGTRARAKAPAQKTRPQPASNAVPVQEASATPRSVFDIPSLDKPCPRCLDLYQREKIRGETVLPIPQGAFAPFEMHRRVKCCRDCAAADTLIRIGVITRARRDDDADREQAFIMARIVVGNDRQEQLRMPGVPMSLVGRGLVAPCRFGDFEKHHVWLKRHGIDPLYPEFIEGSKFNVTPEGNPYE